MYPTPASALIGLQDHLLLRGDGKRETPRPNVGEEAGRCNPNHGQ